MSELAAFHFLRPQCFYLLLPLCALCWLLLRQRKNAGVWRSVCDEALLPYLLVARHGARSRWQPFVFGLCGLVGIIALAGPTWERLPTPVFRDDAALVIVLDLSRSMDASDVSPSRLERAKFKITDILRLRRDGQTALIVYAAEPYVVTPLTSDSATIASHLPALQTDIMPSQGSNASRALLRAVELMRNAGTGLGEILLVTDGINFVDLEDARHTVVTNGVRLTVLGVGTREGAPIPDRSGGFMTDDSGTIIVEPLAEKQLSEFALSSGGFYHTISTDDDDVSAIMARLDADTMQRATTATELFADRWLDMGPWLLLGLLGVVPLAFRRGVLQIGIVAFGLWGGVHHDAAADWWLTPDQQGQRAFDAGDYGAAANSFERPEWRAAARYREQNYAAAVQDFEGANHPEAQYNKGNALARLGRYEEAIAAYDATLATEPEHADALHNKALIEKLLEEQQEQDSSEPDENDRSENEGDNSQGGGQSSSQQSDAQADSSEQNPPQDSEEAADEPQQANDASEEDEASPESADEKDAEAANEEPRLSDQEGDAESASDANTQANVDMESEQATEQWLRQIPDDPGGLLRRNSNTNTRKNTRRKGGAYAHGNDID